MNKQNVTCVMSYDGTCFGFKKELRVHTTPWIDLEDTVLSEISQTQKDTSCVTLLLCPTMLQPCHPLV